MLFFANGGKILLGRTASFLKNIEVVMENSENVTPIGLSDGRSMPSAIGLGSGFHT
jgi:hypothetical protein